MKNNYRKLKLTILLQAVFVTALAVLIGGFLLTYLVDGPYNDQITKAFLDILMAFHLDEESAREWYWKLIGHNKQFFMVIGFLVLFSILFYIALTKMTKYLIQVEEGIDNIVSDSEQPIELITELAPIESRLNEIKTTLKRQEQAAIEGEKKKNDLVVFLAHDLKTPLTSIMAYLSMLDAHPDMPEEERIKYTKISLEKSLRLGELISEFFEITRFNLQDIVLEPMELNLTMMLEQLADEMYAVLQNKHLTCMVNAEEELMITGDADKLARVFDNLLRNAVAYCHADTKILIQAERTQTGVKIVFSNFGETIPERDLQMIFEKFYRMDGSRSSATGGAGLGLAIAKEIVELHGGSIFAQSKDGRTDFIVTLPKKMAEKRGENNEIYAHSRRAPRGRTGRGKKV